jgi:hypothetical protein
MTKVIEISEARRLLYVPESRVSRRAHRVRTTRDYRRLLAYLRLRPSSHRAFLRRFLKRATANGATIEFPVQSPLFPRSSHLSTPPPEMAVHP